jgi:Putative beta barrel porin-7 (BBP7)
VAFPNVIAGRVTIESYSEVYSAAMILRHNIGLGPNGRIDLLGGYRYFKLRETLTIREALVSIDPGGVIPQGTTTDLIDQFATGNDFHGADLGVAAELFWPMVSVEILGKVAIGGAFQRAIVSGETTVVVPGNPAATTAGGLLALPTNIGSYSQAAFGVLPEFGLNTTISLTPDLSLLCGYTLVVLSDVLRSGSQIDRVVNTSQIGDDPLVGAARPELVLRQSTFVLQGLNFGVEHRW